MCGVAVFLSACVKVALEGMDRHDKTVRRELSRVTVYSAQSIVQAAFEL